MTGTQVVLPPAPIHKKKKMLRKSARGLLLQLYFLEQLKPQDVHTFLRGSVQQRSHLLPIHHLKVRPCPLPRLDWTVELVTKSSQLCTDLEAPKYTAAICDVLPSVLYKYVRNPKKAARSHTELIHRARATFRDHSAAINRCRWSNSTGTVSSNCSM